MTHPAAVVQAQLDAYNAKDIDALMATYAPDAQQFTLHGALLAEGTVSAEGLVVAAAHAALTAGLLGAAVRGGQITNIVGNGFDFVYDARNAANAYLAGLTYGLLGGGRRA